jgi:exosortase
MIGFARSPGVWFVGAAFAPMVGQYFARLWALEHYQFFPFALLGAGLLAERSRKMLLRPSPPSRGTSIAWTAFGFGLLTVALVLGSPWCGYTAACAMLGAAIYRYGGRANVVRFLPTLLMLATLVRLPLDYDRVLIAALQLQTTRSADAALDVLDVAHVRSGNVLEIPGRRLFVEEACSGINSLFSAVACTLFFVLWTRRPPFVAFVLLVGIPGWVIVANTARITLVAVLRDRWDVAADEGRLHDALGLIVFTGTMGLIGSTERLLAFYGAVLPPEDFSPAVAAPSPGPTVGGDRAVPVPSISRLCLCWPGRFTISHRLRPTCAWTIGRSIFCRRRSPVGRVPATNESNVIAVPPSANFHKRGPSAARSDAHRPRSITLSPDGMNSPNATSRKAGPCKRE